MLQLVADSNQLLIQYKASLNLTSPIPRDVTFKVIEGVSKGSQVVKNNQSSKPSGFGKTAKYIYKKIIQSDSEQEVPTVSAKVVKDVYVPGIVVKKSNNLKTKSKSSSVVIKQITDNKFQKKRKHSGVRLLQNFKKFRAQTFEELSTTATPTTNIFEEDQDREETHDDLPLHDSRRKDSTIESHTKETHNPDVTVNASDMDTNIDSSESISTSLPKSISVTPPEGPISKYNMEEGRSSNISEKLSNKDLNITIGKENSTSIIDTSTFPPPPPPSSPSPTSTIIPITIFVISCTFESILNEPIASLFYSE